MDKNLFAFHVRECARGFGRKVFGPCILDEHYTLPALGSGRLDLCVEYRNKRYAVEVKTSKNFSGEKSYAQLAGYLDKLGLPDGWMAVFDADKSKSWDEKLYNHDIEFNGKTLHLIGL